MRETLQVPGQGEIIIANGVRHGGFDSFASSQSPFEVSTPEEGRTLGPVDLEEGVVSEIPNCEQMSCTEVMARLEQINLDYAGTDLLWGDPNPIQEIYMRLNRRVQIENLWGDPRDTAFSPIAAAQAAIKK